MTERTPEALPTTELLQMLRSPDPAVRDDTATSVLADRIQAGGLDGELVELGDQLTVLFHDTEVQARTFAPLLLAEVVDRDRVSGAAGPAAIHRWRSAFIDWWLGEQDLRGWDDQIGWLHAIAHGADAVLAFANSPSTGPAVLGELLTAIARRVTTTDAVFTAAEEDRLAYAITGLLAHPQLTEQAATGWLTEITELLGPGEPGPVPARASNTARTLTTTYLFIDRGVRSPSGDHDLAIAHRDAVRDAIAAAYRTFWPLLC